ncbi:RyR domain-containing protein [Bacillus sp. 1P10SD]|uniref:RyR domain-containing protein n=1 Tax=Bacillus sp. 1P10SD TaxID=3132265 RepID=UPI0039A60F1C
MNYQPKPLDTTKIKLSNDIQELQEKLAENIHEIWALQRFQQGWTYGAERNDQKKEHPNLVPYNELTEEDKDYDRSTAMETLKTILSLGYTIRKNETK